MSESMNTSMNVYFCFDISFWISFVIVLINRMLEGLGGDKLLFIELPPLK